MPDFFYWGGPVYCSTAEKIVWERPTQLLCKPLEGSSNGAFFNTLGADPVGTLLGKAGVAERGSVGFAGFSAFHGFLDPLLQAQADQVDYVHLADACFSGAGATAPKKGLLAFAKRAVVGKARMTVTTNGPWDKDIHYWGGAGTKYEGVEFSLTSGAKCFGNVWRDATGGQQPSFAEVPPGVPAPDRIFRSGELYWFHYEGMGQKDPHGWHANTLAAPYIQKYGAPWMAGRGGALPGLPGLPSVTGAGTAVAAFAAIAALVVGGYWLGRRYRYFPNYATQFPKTCPCCGRIYSQAQWTNLPLLGKTQYDDCELEYRNCICGTTLALYAEGSPQFPE